MPILFLLLEALVALAAPSRSAGPAALQDYQVDQAASQLYVIVHRAGLFSFLGHEHAIVPRDWTASLCLADPVPEGAHGTLSLRTATLVIDSESARSLAHLEGGPSDEDRQDIQHRMLDADHLDVDRYPDIRLDVVASAPQSDDRVSVRGTITLHGVTRNVEFPVIVQGGRGGPLVLRGTVRIRQRDFGIEPESRAGLVKVANEVDLLFLLLAEPTGSACAGAS
jgi:polyisoprenoid-binding protein YceI